MILADLVLKGIRIDNRSVSQIILFAQRVRSGVTFRLYVSASRWWMTVRGVRFHGERSPQPAFPRCGGIDFAVAASINIPIALSANGILLALPN
jgi:hypothetical protein